MRAPETPEINALKRRKAGVFLLERRRGPLVRTLPIAKWLAEHGIGSSLGIGGAIGAHLRAAGYEVIEAPLPAFNAPADAARGWWSPYHFLSDCSLGTELLVEHVEAYRTAIRDGQPAIVLTDINPLAALAAKSLQVPHISISQSVFLPYRKLHSTRWRMPPALPRINKVLARYGAAPLASAEHLEVGEITFIPSLPEFDPTQDVPPTLHYVGPILGNEFIPLLPQTHRRCAARPWILFYPGRPHDTAGSSGQTLFNLASEALNPVAARVTIATGGHDFDVPQSSRARFEIVPWCLLSRDCKPDLIIHHGGHGACLTAMSAGIPSVVVPSHAEREYNARNLAAMGCGEVLVNHGIDAPHLRRAIEKVIETAEFTANCAQWSRTIAARKYGGPDLVARMIRQMIG